MAGDQGSVRQSGRAEATGAFSRINRKRANDRDAREAGREPLETRMTKASWVFAAVAMAISFDVSSSAAERRLEAGILTCRMAPSVGLILGSRQRMRCRFVRTAEGRIERSLGSVTRFGLDLGVTAGGVMRWRALTRTRSGRGVLAGHSVGASGSVSVGAGLGAKALIGGSRRSTMLQPLAFSANVGVNLAGGVTGLTLRFQG